MGRGSAGQCLMHTTSSAACCMSFFMLERGFALQLCLIIYKCCTRWAEAVLVSNTVDAYNPLGSAACCTPSASRELFCIRAAAVMSAPSRVSHDASPLSLAWMHTMGKGSTDEQQHRCMPPSLGRAACCMLSLLLQMCSTWVSERCDCMQLVDIKVRAMSDIIRELHRMVGGSAGEQQH